MKAFKYRARTDTGTEIEGVLEANTREEALEQLRDSGLIISAISDSGGEHDIDLRLGGRKTKEKALSIMCNQFAIILQAGIPIVRALELVSHQSEDKTLKKILSDVADDVSAGYNLADSFSKHGSGLPTTFIETVRAGETSGNLDVVFRRLSTYYEKSSKTKSKVKSAMIYPSFVLVVAVVVVIIIMVFAVPTFASTFEGMGTELPFVTKLLINTSNFMASFWWLILAVIIAIALAIHLAKKFNEDFRLKWSELGVRIPVIGRINHMSASSQYASTMSVMMEAGLNVVTALEVTAKGLSNYYMSHSLGSILPDLEAGKPLATCLTKLGTFPELVNEMTGVGEQTGALESTLNVLAEYYDNEVETATSRAMSLIEPLMIVFLAGIVLVILLAVYLPMFDIYGSFNSTL